ncbi:MAG TPA: WbuC family cupin fold metalloprotein [Planctomycetaceae bacterium]|jgi:glucose-6-phosphate isomerase|nr:WbuC family cupin fold metalloprotein [Planctomycetaceae bacterium]
MTDSTVPPEIAFTTSAICVVDDATLASIREAAHASPRKRARLCLHSELSSPLHNMIIVLLRGTEVAIHRHPRKPECYHVMSGLMTLIVFDADGRNPRRIPLGPFGSGRSPVCRIPAGVWHSVDIETDEVVLHESTIGPYSPADTEYFSEPLS